MRDGIDAAACLRARLGSEPQYEDEVMTCDEQTKGH